MNSKTPLIYAGIIPARYASMRFPGKPLALIGDKTMVQLVYEQASKALDIVYVATDDKRISDAVHKFGGKAVMTSPNHMSGTDRCAETAEIMKAETRLLPDVIINIQGDEPFIKPEQIELLKGCFEDPDVMIATLVRQTEAGEDIFNPNQVKVVIDKNGYAMYFSRSAIPYLRGEEPQTWTHKHSYYKHIGLYAYRTNVLAEITKLDRSPLEISESLEQNRWLENNYTIKTARTEWESIGIDTPEDLEKAKELFKIK